MQLMDVRDRQNKNYALAMQQLADFITAGRCVDFADYKARCGRIKGLKDAMDINDQLFHKIIAEGQDDETPNTQDA